MNQITVSAHVIEKVKCWLEILVIGEGLCPFAHQPYQSGRIRFLVSSAQDEETLLTDVLAELLFLRETPLVDAETSLLILPQMLQDFLDYNDFLDLVDALLQQEQMEGEFQIASMHPDYQFADTDFDDAQNYTNRSPYPILHLLREESLNIALQQYPHPEQIPERNIRHMQKLGAVALETLISPCMAKGPR
ncbi:MAG: DUF1415 domain-containing protein [Gammaproteobacteria bacterium]|nr:DUF1415 domain-containing protein [Gammaproteobacteria bacterium]